MPAGRRWHAPAKINLSLEILGKRPDGFHDLVSVMQEVSLQDVLLAEPAEELEFACSDRSLSRPDNLASRAADLLRRSQRARGAHIRLEKHIPVAAGLGGGSSDAASVLLMLNQLWQLGLPCDALMDTAAALGSDVPFFLHGGTALVEGRGECVTALPDPATSWYVLTNPGIAVSTGEIFAALDPSEWTDGAATRRVARRVEKHRHADLGVNTLQPVLFRLYPQALHCFEAAGRLAPGRTIVSGSGPTVVSRFGDERSAVNASATLRRHGYWTAVVHSLPRDRERTPCA